jgi:hypothetical protein
VRRFQAPLLREMHAAGDVPFATVHAWLTRTTGLLVDAPAGEHGRLAGLLGFGRVTFSTLTVTCRP